MDLIDAQLALGRAELSAQQLRAASRCLTGGDSVDSACLAALVGQRQEQLIQLGIAPRAGALLAVPNLRQIERDRRWLERTGIQLIDALSAAYPIRLATAAGAPALLYINGNADLLSAAQLAMVGSRHPTEEGRRIAHTLARQLAQAGLLITSGLALGIDAASHAGALEGCGQTIAVLGCGLDRIYPREHEQLAAHIARQGLLVTPFAPACAPRRSHFPRRNRLMSSLALGTLVVEATRASGSLLTARFATRQGRPVLAVPGSIHNPLSRGCHQLIRSGATLIEGSADVLEALKLSVPEQLLINWPERRRRDTATADPLDKEHKILLDALGFGPASIDILVERTGLPSQSIVSKLLILELEGAVQLQAGGRYMRIQSR